MSFQLIYIPITEVKPGDYVLSLNEETGRIEPHRINGLLDMGVKLVFKLTTEDGRTIRTTGNHPYLVRGEISEKDRERYAQQRLNDLQARGLLKEEFSEEREFAQPVIIWKDTLMEGKLSFQSSQTFVNINSHRNFSFQRLETDREFISQRINAFVNPINLLIQPSDFHLNGSYVGLDSLQFRNNQLLNNLFKIYSSHNLLLSYLKDTIGVLACQVRNSGLAYASMAPPVEESWLKAIYLREGDEIAVLNKLEAGRKRG